MLFWHWTSVSGSVCNGPVNQKVLLCWNHTCSRDLQDSECKMMLFALWIQLVLACTKCLWNMEWYTAVVRTFIWMQCRYSRCNLFRCNLRFRCPIAWNQHNKSIGGFQRSSLVPNELRCSLASCWVCHPFKKMYDLWSETYTHSWEFMAHSRKLCKNLCFIFTHCPVAFSSWTFTSSNA